MPTVRELEALVAERRRLLEEAEDALARAKARAPEVGDFVRSTLTNFYGQVTKVIPRPSDRPWVEMRPYLAPNLPGTSTLDLYDAWEIIDAPSSGPASEQEPTSLEIVRNLTEVIVTYGPDAAARKRG
jgi:hypothetical protein